MPPSGLGVAPLDRRLGPIPEHASILLTNDPGADPQPFLHHAVAGLINRRQRVVYCAIDRPAASVNLQLLGLGMDAQLADKNLIFVDGYSRGSGIAGEHPTWPSLLDPRDMQRATNILKEIAAREAASTVVVDSLSSFADEAPRFADFIQELPELVDALRAFEMSISVFTRWPYPEAIDPICRGFDAVIALHGLHARARFGDYFTIDQVDWNPNAPRKPVAYVVRPPSGVVEYIPKILVTGPFHAGKTTFVQNVSQTAKSVNRLGTTVVLDHGQLVIDDFTADIFGTAGQSRFDSLLSMLAGSAMGIVLVVDSTNAHSLKRARTMVDATRNENIPLVVAANKQDLEGALSTSEIASTLGLPPDVRVLPCTATDAESCRRILTQLVRQIRQPEVLP